MKLKIFLILFGCLQVHAAVYSQNDVKISLDLENVSLEEVIWAIERQTDFVFMYGHVRNKRCGESAIPDREGK